MTRVAMPSVDSVDSVNSVNTAADHGPGPGPRDIQMSPVVVPGQCCSAGHGASLHQSALVSMPLMPALYDDIMVLSLMKHLTMTMYKPSPAGAACRAEVNCP